MDGSKMPNGDTKEVSRQRSEAELVSLARFPEENPDPVLRVNNEGEVLYRNRATDEVLRRLGFSTHDVRRFLPENLKELIRGALKAGRLVTKVDIGLKGRTYSFRLVPIRDHDYVNVYVEDTTGRRKVEEGIRTLNQLQAAMLDPAPLEDKLRKITDGVVNIFSADFARIWLIRPGDRCDSGCVHAAAAGGPYACRHRERCLHLVSSSGRYTHLDGDRHRRVPFGCYKVGKIASGEDPGFLTNDVARDPNVHDHEWAQTLGLVSFAGFQLRTANGETVGVIAFFSKNAISSDEYVLFGSLSNMALRAILAAKEEEALKASEARYRLLAENMADFVWTADMGLKFTYTSPSLTKLLGYIPKEIIGRGVGMVLAPHSLERASEIIKEEMAIEDSVSPDPLRTRVMELEHVRKDGSHIHTEVEMMFLRDVNKRPVGIIGVTHNITERKKKEEELRQSSLRLQEAQEQLIQAEKLSAVGQLASGVAHEVKNPLGIVLQGIDYLEKKIPAADKDSCDTLSMMKDGIGRADKIINALLDFSKSARLDLHPENMNAILETTLDLVKVGASFMGIQIIREMNKYLPEVFVDKNKMEQVFINLLLNAVQAMKHSGKLTVRSYDKALEKAEILTGIGGERYFKAGERVVVVEIEDTGIGIPEENLRKIFEPFFTTKRSAGGAGLGLAVSLNIIVLHKGMIRVQSQPGKGTTVTVTLKTAREAQWPEEEY